MEFVELGALSFRDWARVIGSEREPFGTVSAGLEFRPKDHHVGVRDDRGRLIAVAGATVAKVEVEGHGRFEVAGQGALIVCKEMRGRGLSVPLMDRLKALVARLGPDRAMLFCDPGLIPLYAGRGYEQIAAPVWADQPRGPIEMPLPAMWRAVRPAAWPRGVVRLDGLPF